MRIGILGGSFDPPHNAHLYIAKTLLKHKYCQKVILIPCFKHPFGKPITDAKHRFAMTRLLTAHTVIPAKAGIQESTRFPIPTSPSFAGRGKSGMTKTHRMSKLLEERSIEVSNIEIKTNRISYTIDTLNALKTQSPQDEFLLIIGEDQIESFEKWKRWKEIIEKFGLIVVPRNTPEVKELPTSEVAKQRLRLLGGVFFKPLPISSSEIRKRISKGLSVNKLVPREVERYIIKHKLYR